MGEREIDTMNTSFIDLICCALGSMLMLMLFVACLLKASALKDAAAAQEQSVETKASQPVDTGYQPAPPSPTMVTLTWKKPAKHPLTLIAYPPLIRDPATEDQDELC